MAERILKTIRVDDIDVVARLRSIDLNEALLLASSLATEGLLSPIEVRPTKSGRFTLVAGAHRLEAARLLHWTEIDAFILDLTIDQARLREIDENVYRRDLSELDRAVFLAEKKRLHEKLYPHTKHGGDRRSADAKSAIFGDLISRFSDEVCDRLGYSERTIQRMVARAGLDPEVRARIAGTWIAHKGQELDALLRLPPEDQRKAVALLLDSPQPPKNVASAARQLAGVRPATVSAADAEFDLMLKAWRRASAPVRRRFLEHLATTGEFAPDTSERDAA